MNAFELDAVLEAATTTTAQRKALLAAAPWQVRDDLVKIRAARGYTEMMTAPTDTLKHRLDATPDAAARAALLRTATVKARAQLAWDVRWHNVSDVEAAAMYLEMIDPGAV
jgi:hypothetical protein